MPTLKMWILKLYVEEKLKLKNLLRGQRVCDILAKSELHDLLLISLILIGICIRKSSSFAEFLIIGVKPSEEWGVDSIFKITFNNACSKDVDIEYLKRRIKDKNSTVLESKFLYMWCVAHILNLCCNRWFERLT